MTAPEKAPETALAGKPTRLQSFAAAASSWRIGAVTLLSLSSGMPLGLVLTSVPAWMAMVGVDIKTIGVITLAQAPYAFKFLWSPLMDRFPLPFLGRKRGWILLAQVALFLSTLALAFLGEKPSVTMVAALTVLVAFASATQDIAIDAYTVESLRPEEQGLAVGARIAAYRAGMWIAGHIAITLAAVQIGGRTVGWSAMLMLQAVLYLLLAPVTVFAPEPEAPPRPPKTMREAVWEPFVGFFRQHRALEIAAFLVLYKLGDNLATALIRPFFLQKGYDPIDVGAASGTVGLVATMLGTFLGGLYTSSAGVGRALWLFGILQAVAHTGYAVVAQAEVNRWLMYGAMGLEASTSGMATGAFSVFLLRLTQKKFSATQFALFSSIFALGRTIAGPPAGAIVAAIGWRDFFLLTFPLALPGLVMLHRFVPWGTREVAAQPDEAAAPALHGTPVSTAGLLVRGLLGVVGGTAFALLGNATLGALKLMKDGKPFDLLAPLIASLSPEKTADFLTVIGCGVFGLIAGFGVAAYVAARRGIEVR